MSTDKRDDMSDDEIAMRKFLKQLGVTAHQELEAALQAAVAEGKLAAGAEVAVSAEVTIAELGYVHRVEGNLLTPGSNG
jgi:hypothetical protein